jgi:multidrug resistance efflux pump
MTLAMPKASPPPRRLREILLAAAGLLLIGGGLYWFYADQISLTGRVTGAAIPVKAPIAGTVSRIPAREGQSVPKGEPLLFLKDDGLRDALERERQALARMEAAVPPSLRPSLAGTAPNLEALIPLAQQAEAEALRFVGEASTAEAGAAVAARRAALLRQEGRIAEERRQEALLAHERTKKVLEQARAEYENKSLARAAAVAELRGLREAMRGAGLNMREYEEQRARTRTAEENLGAAVLRAPEDGFVTEILAGPDATLTAGQTALHFLPLAASPEIVLFVSEKTAALLAPGQRCVVRVASVPGALEGAVASLSPRPSGSRDDQEGGGEEENILVRIRLAFKTQPAVTGNPPFLPDGAAAVATIYLQ